MALTAVAFVQRHGGKYIGTDQEVIPEARQVLEIIEHWEVVRDILLLPPTCQYQSTGGFLGYRIREDDVLELDVRGRGRWQGIHLLSANSSAIATQLEQGAFRLRNLGLRLMCES